jgi:ADP-heptose:LPS heptosyltransferase
MFWLGVPRSEIPRAKLSAGTAPDLPPYAVIHPFASKPEKTWPAERFIAVARFLKDHHGLESVFLAGPLDDARAFSGSRVWHNASLASAKNLISGAQLFVGNDSGPAHVAAAFGVPVVVLFGASDPETWAPWRTESQVLTAPNGIAAISTADATAAVEALKVGA